MPAVLNLIGQFPDVYLPLAGLLGLMVGSFLNVVIYRLPLMQLEERRQASHGLLGIPYSPQSKMTLALPASACPCCGRKIKPWENIPVLSFILLRGRCAGCRSSISVRYPLVEFAGGVVGVIAAGHFGFTLDALAFAGAYWALIAIVLISNDGHSAPLAILVALVWGGLLLCATSCPDQLTLHVTSAAAMFTLMRAVRLDTTNASVGAAAGAWLGLTFIPAFLLLSAVLALLMRLASIPQKTVSLTSPVTTGMATAFLIVSILT